MEVNFSKNIFLIPNIFSSDVKYSQLYQINYQIIFYHILINDNFIYLNYFVLILRCYSLNPTNYLINSRLFKID